MRLLLCSRQKGVRVEGTVADGYPDNLPPGKNETPENGWVWIELTGVDVQEKKEFLDGDIVDNPDYVAIVIDPKLIQERKVMKGERLTKISLDSPIPIHPRAARSMHGKSKGRTIRPHLEKMCLQMRRSGLITKRDSDG